MHGSNQGECNGQSSRGTFHFPRFSDYTLVLATVDSHALVMGTYSCLGIESEERTAN